MDDYQQFEMSSYGGGGGCKNNSGCLSFIIAMVAFFGIIGWIVSWFE
ncbi:MAG: hypothetical protein RR900_02525 [Ruthenibacterium sp.]